MTEDIQPTAGSTQEDTATNPGQEPKTYDAEYVGKLRKESADYRTKLRDAEQKLTRLAELEEAEKQRQAASLSETEKLQNALAESEKAKAQMAEQFKSARIRHAVELAALGMNFQDAGDAYTLIDLSAVEMTDEGPKGVKEALEALAKAKPYLLKDGKTPPGSPPRKPGGNTPPKPPDDKPAKPFIRF